MDNHRISLWHILVFVVGGVLGFTIGYISHRTEPRIVEKVVTEETIVYDTLTQIKPVYVDRVVKDSIMVSVHDTVKVYMPREERTYQDSSYRAVVSGYEPSLDFIEVYQQTRYVDRIEYIQPRRWGFSFQLGAGLIYDIPRNKVGFGLYSGIGFYYRF